jgi:4-amino-4-deoxy-L-arabinose transferase-like glycosyltransferase
VSPNRVLLATLAAYTVLAVAVALLTPPGEANDEPSHVRNVESIVGGELYRITPESGSESHQAPLYYLTLAAWQKAWGVPQFELTVEGTGAPIGRGPHWRHDGPREAAMQRRIDLLRAPGIVMGLSTIILTWLAIRFLSSDPWTPVIAATVVAFVPRFVFLTGVVNNDNLATLLGAAATCLAAWLVGRRPDERRIRIAWAAIAGAVLAAAMLSKVTALVVAPGVVLALLLVVRRSRERLALLAVIGVVALTVSGWWLARNQVLYGDPLGNAASIAHLRELYPALFPTDNLVLRALVTIPAGAWASTWYTSGWNQFTWPDLAYVPFWTLLGIGAIAGIAGLWRSNDGRGTASALSNTIESTPATAAPSRAGIAILAAFALGGAFAVWFVGLQTTQQQARIGFVGLPALAGLTAIGYERLRWPLVARFALPALGFLGTIVAIWMDVLSVFH